MLPARCGRSILEERVHCESPHCCPSLLFSCLTDCFTSQQFCWGASGPADLHICSSRQCHPLFFFFLWTVHETCLSDWLVLRGRWIQRTHWLDLCWGGKQPFLRIRFSLIQSMGKRSKENIEWVVLLLELLLVKFLDVHVLNLYFQSNVKCTHRQADKVPFWFYAWTHLHSLCPCL